MDKQKSGMKKRTALLLICILGAAVILGIVFYFINDQKPGKVIIKVDGQTVYEDSLYKDASFNVEGYDGGFNKVEIKNGKVDVTEADCPDKICVNMDMIDKTGETIVCLPHKMVIEITGTKESIDGVVQ